MTNQQFEKIKEDIQKVTNTTLTFTGKYKVTDLLSDFCLWKYAFDNKPQFNQNQRLNSEELTFVIYCFVQLLRKHYFVDGNKRFAFEFLYQNVIKIVGQWMYIAKNYDQMILQYIEILESNKTDTTDLLVFNMLIQNFLPISFSNQPEKLEQWKNQILLNLAKEQTNKK